MSACHSLNGLEEHETWRDTGLIVGGGRVSAVAPYQQVVTTACHHCVDPGCLEGCPVVAYEKDADTGIVRHLDDQCIGCQYCVLKCPYDVPKYSDHLGIVRKCDMCHERLAVGEAPACVQACPSEAIRITTVSVTQVRAEAVADSQMLPGAFDSSYTKPTTRYVTAKGIPADARPADAHAYRLEHAHWPLILMLILSQVAVGLLVVLAALGLASPAEFRAGGFSLAAGGFLVFNAGLVAAFFHLGKPLGAWRFFLGLRTSWMSREILVFNLLAGAAFAAAGATWFFPGSSLALAAVLGAALVGLLAVYASGMVYIDTKRPAWAARIVFAKFYGATIALGGAAGAVTLAWTEVISPGHTDLGPAIRAASALAIAVRTGLFAFELVENAAAYRNPAHPLHRVAMTMHHLLSWVAAARMVLGTMAIVGSVVVVFDVEHLTFVWGTAALVAGLASQVLERYAFFAAAAPPRMPGAV